MSFTEILYEVRGRTALVTLNRPDRMNAFTATMMTEMIEAMDRASADDAVRAVIFTGAGRAFCAGADLGKGGATFDYRERPKPADGEHRDGGGRVALRIFEMRKPVIAAINGPAVGVGATMTLPMDFRLAAEGAKMGFVFARRGITPEACSTWFLPRLVGIAQAADWVYSGRVFPIAEALEKGLVQRVLPPGDLLPAAFALAEEIGANTSAVSVALARQMMWRMLGAADPMDAHRIESKAIFHTGTSADAREGVQSFLEKRPAVFTDTIASAESVLA